MPKDEIRKNLLEEQHYLCAYCMRRIEDNGRKTSIEHWYPLSQDKEKALVMLMYVFNHSSISTTKKYIGIMDEEIESVFNDLNLGMNLI